MADVAVVRPDHSDIAAVAGQSHWAHLVDQQVERIRQVVRPGEQEALVACTEWWRQTWCLSGLGVS